MRQKLKNRIFDYFGKGKALIVYGPNNSKKEEFVFFELKNEITKAGYNCIDTNGYSIEKIISCLPESDDSITFGRDHIVFLVHKELFDTNPIPIIDLSSGRRDIEIIAVSDTDIRYSLGKEATNARGRYMCFYFPTFVFEDFDTDLLEEPFNGGFWYKNDLFKYKFHSVEEEYISNTLLSFNSRPCSLRDIQKKLLELYSYKLSVPTIANRIFALCKKCIFSSIDRMDVKTQSLLGGKKSYVPCSMSLYKWEDIVKMPFEDIAFIFSFTKMTYDGNDFYRGIYDYQLFADYSRFFIQKDDLAIMYKNNIPFLIYFVEHINQESLNDYLKIKTNMIKVLVCNDPYPNYFVESGVIIYTFNDFVKKGFNLYGI